MKKPPLQFGFLRAKFWPIGFEKRPPWLLKRCNPGFVFDGPLYHYTSVDSLIGVVRERGFWMSHSSFLNDASELVHGRDLVINTLGRLAKKRRYGEFSQIVLLAADLLRTMRSEFFVASFSREADSLEQWRAYCNGGGINLELDCKSHGGDLGVGPRMVFQEAMYDDREKIEFVVFSVRRFHMEYCADQRAGIDNADLIREWAEHLASSLEHRFATFKHPAFKSEREVRLVVHRDSVRFFGRPRHRARAGKIIPYLRTNDWCEANEYAVPTDKTPLSIVSVTIGPQPDIDLVAESVRLFLYDAGYTNARVRHSSVPHRQC